LSTSFGSIKRQSMNVQDPNWANNSNNITPTRARLPAPLVANHHGTITGPHASGIPELNTRSIEMIGERASDGRLGLANEAGLRRINGSSPLIFSLSLSLSPISPFNPVYKHTRTTPSRAASHPRRGAPSTLFVHQPTEIMYTRYMRR